jgi:hypothetical protein
MNHSDTLEQKPVAYMGTDIEGNPNKFRLNPFRGCIPLYTTPPAQRQWVGLTQQDIDIAFDDTQEGGGFNEFARAIEAKLKEKNNG